MREEAGVALASSGCRRRYVEELDLPFPVAGAVRFDDQAEFHPVKYLEGIAAALEGPLYEGTMAHARASAAACARPAAAR